MEHIYQQHWITLSRELREHLTKVFDIPTSGISEVRDNTVISDGKTNEDLNAITKEKMEEYTGSKDNFMRLFEISVSKAKYEINPPKDNFEVGGMVLREVSNEEFNDIVNNKEKNENNKEVGKKNKK